MPYNDYPAYFQHILTAITNIRLFRGAMSFDEIAADRKTEAAIERELAILSEAASRLGDRAVALCPEADWKAIRAIGNVLRHAYDRLDPVVLKQTLDDELAELEPLVQRAVRQMHGEPEVSS